MYPSRTDGERSKKEGGLISLLLMIAALHGSCRTGKKHKVPWFLNTTCFEENISGTGSGNISQKQPKGGAENGNDCGGACFCC